LTSDQRTSNNSWLDSYRGQIGRHRADVTTPALLLDLDVARRNSAAMAARFRDLSADLRPHIKVHKSAPLARMEIAAGAIGVACATIWEAQVMAEAGIADVLIANQVVSQDKVAALAELAREHRITVAVDDARNVAQLQDAAKLVGSKLEVLVEIDVGMGRCGVRTKEAALRIAEQLRGCSRLEMRGLQGYEGHAMVQDSEARLQAARAANATLIEAADYLEERGQSSAVLSGGGTGSYLITGANSRINEVQAGSYLLMDCFHDSLVPGDFEFALSVLGTVVSAQESTIVLDAGRKSVGIEFVTPRLAGIAGGTVRYFAEEHCVVDFASSAPLDLGDTAEILPGYAPTTVNLHDVFHVVEANVVTDIWPVDPRGSGVPRDVRGAEGWQRLHETD